MTSSHSEGHELIKIHPDFKVLALANPAGYPFLGNDFFSECGDVFSCHVVENPDPQSQELLLQAYGPNVATSTVQALVRVFDRLRVLNETGVLSYPFSTREQVNIVKHLQKYPADSVAAAAENVLAFDRHEPELIETLTAVFESEGIRGIVADTTPQYVVGVTLPSPLGRTERQQPQPQPQRSEPEAAASATNADARPTAGIANTTHSSNDGGGSGGGTGMLWSESSPVECDARYARLKTKNTSYLLSANKTQPPSERNIGRQQQFTEAVVQLRGDAVEAEYAAVDERGSVHVLSRAPSQLQSFDASSLFEATTVIDLEPLLGKMPCSGLSIIPGSPGSVLIHCVAAGAVGEQTSPDLQRTPLLVEFLERGVCGGSSNVVLGVWVGVAVGEVPH